MSQTSNPITVNALKVFTKEELAKLDRISLSNLAIILQERLKVVAEPTLAELRGIRRMVEVDLKPVTMCI